MQVSAMGVGGCSFKLGMCYWGMRGELGMDILGGPEGLWLSVGYSTISYWEKWENHLGPLTKALQKIYKC